MYVVCRGSQRPVLAVTRLAALAPRPASFAQPIQHSGGATPMSAEGAWPRPHAASLRPEAGCGASMRRRYAACARALSNNCAARAAPWAGARCAYFMVIVIVVCPNISLMSSIGSPPCRNQDA